MLKRGIRKKSLKRSPQFAKLGPSEKPKRVAIPKPVPRRTYRKVKYPHARMSKIRHGKMTSRTNLLSTYNHVRDRYGADVSPPSLSRSLSEYFTVDTDYTGAKPSSLRDSPHVHSFRRELSASCLGQASPINPNGLYYSGTVLGSPPFRTVTGDILLSWDPSVANAALDELTEKVRSNVDLSIDLFEAGQTRNMVKRVGALVSFVRNYNPLQLKRDAKDFAKKYFHLYRNRWKSQSEVLEDITKRSLKGPGSLWLEYTYGVKPLAQDIFDAAVQLPKWLPPHFTVRAKSSRYWIDRYQDNVSCVLGGTRSMLVERVHRERAEFICEFDFKPSDLEFFSRFTSLNPVSIAWELMPYSFVVDWVYNVGGYLRNLETACLYANQFKSGVLVRSRSTDWSFPNWRNTHTFDGYQFVLSQSGFARFNRKERTILSSYPTPTLPRFDVQVGSGRMLNAAALLSQLLKR